MIYINIKEILKSKGKTKYWLVKEMESDYQTIGALMDNKTTAIKFETLEKLCNILKCTPNDIIKFNDQ